MPINVYFIFLPFNPHHHFPHLFFFFGLFVSSRVWRAAMQPGDGWGGELSLDVRLAPENPRPNLGVRPSAWPLQAERQHKETKTSLVEACNTKRAWSGPLRTTLFWNVLFHVSSDLQPVLIVLILVVSSVFCLRCAFHICVNVWFNRWAHHFFGPGKFPLFGFLAGLFIYGKITIYLCCSRCSHPHWVITVPLPLLFSEELQQTAAWLIS